MKKEISEKAPEGTSINVEGIVSIRNKLPYVVIVKKEEGKESERIVQLSMSEARSLAEDILVMCSRVEADAMIFKFFNKHEFPMNAAIQIMQDFREFRYELDKDMAEKFQSEPTLSQDFDFTKKKPQ